MLSSATSAVFVLILVTFLTGCDVLNSIFPSRNRVENGAETIRLREGAQKELETLQVVIRFDQVINESRCPEGAQCPWAGQATIGVTFTPESGEPTELRLTISGFVDADTGDGYEPVDTLGYRLTLLELAPYPHVEETSSDTMAVATIRVSQL